MRVQVEGKNGDKIEGVIALKDESFVMLRIRGNMVRIFHWEHINDVKRVSKGDRQSINLDVFRKTRE